MSCPPTEKSAAVVLLVRADEGRLYEYFRGSFRGCPEVEVVQDRRVARETARAAGTDQERRDRRREDDVRRLLNARGWALVQRGGPR
jgi:hypothetical protein